MIRTISDVQNYTFPKVTEADKIYGNENKVRQHAPLLNALNELAEEVIPEGYDLAQRYFYGTGVDLEPILIFEREGNLFKFVGDDKFNGILDFAKMVAETDPSYLDALNVILKAFFVESLPCEPYEPVSEKPKDWIEIIVTSFKKIFNTFK